MAYQRVPANGWISGGGWTRGLRLRPAPGREPPEFGRGPPELARGPPELARGPPEFGLGPPHWNLLLLLIVGLSEAMLAHV